MILRQKLKKVLSNKFLWSSKYHPFVEIVQKLFLTCFYEVSLFHCMAVCAADDGHWKKVKLTCFYEDWWHDFKHVGATRAMGTTYMVLIISNETTQGLVAPMRHIDGFQLSRPMGSMCVSWYLLHHCHHQVSNLLHQLSVDHHHKHNWHRVSMVTKVTIETLKFIKTCQFSLFLHREFQWWL